MTATMAERTRMIIDTEEALRLAVKLRAMKDGCSTSEVVNKILRRELREELADTHKYLPKKPKS